MAANRSRAIESWLATLPREPAVVRVGTRAAVAGLEDRIAQVDDLNDIIRIDGVQPTTWPPCSASGFVSLARSRRCATRKWSRPSRLEYQTSFEDIVKTKSTRLMAAAVLAAPMGILTPLSAWAAADESPDAVYSQPAVSWGMGREVKDLDAQAGRCRARLEEAAHEVAELSNQMSGPLMTT